MKKRIHIIFLAVLFMFVITNLTGCNMFLNRKKVAEEALKNQYGEEFVPIIHGITVGIAFGHLCIRKMMRV